MRKFLLLVVWLPFILNFNAFAQESDQPDSVSEKKYDFLMIDADFQPVTTFLGRDFGQSLAWGSLRATYVGNSGIYFSGSATFFGNSDLSGLVGGGMGYSHSISSKIDIDASMWYYAGGSYINSEGEDQIFIPQLSIGWDWNALYTTFQFQALVNQPFDFIWAIQNSRYFQLDKPILGTGILSFEPRLTFSFGTTNFYELGGYEISDDQMLQLSKFQFQALEFSLPFTLNFGNFDLKVEASYIQPVHVPSFDTSTARFFLGGGVTYSLPIAKK